MHTQTNIKTDKKLHVWHDVLREGQPQSCSYFIIGPNDDERQLRDAALKEWARIGNPPICRAAIITTTTEEITL